MNVDDLDRLYRAGQLTRSQFITALGALGVTVSGLEGLFGSTLEADAAATDRTVAPKDRYLALIVMDGFRADYLRLAPMRHLRALMARGTTFDTAWVGHLEAETPTGHATLVTGVYPRKHSVIGFGWRDAATGAFTYLPTDLRQIRAGALTRTIAGSGVPTISDLIHARNPRDLTVSVSGEKYYASATMGAGADYVLYGKDDSKQVFRPVSIGRSMPPAGTHIGTVRGASDFVSQDAFSADLAVRLLRTLRPRALFVNLPDPDIAGHYYGGMRSPRDMATALKGTDAALGRIVDEYRRLGLLERTVFVVTADHGMAANSHIVPIHPMYKAVASPASAGTLDEEFRISMGSIWLKDMTQDRAVATALVAARFPGVEGAIFKVASGSGYTFTPHPATAARLGHDLTQAYLNLANTAACLAGPDVILPYAEDTMGLTMRRRKRWGTHGGFSWGVQHVPLILAGPGVPHRLSHMPAKLIDVAPTINRLLGLPVPDGTDGVVLADAIQGASRADRSAQRSVSTSRSKDVRALRAHSAAQLKASDS